MVEIKNYIRPTQIVRSVMRAHGKPTYMIYTNKYDTCRTVKCYVRDSGTELIGDIRTALVKAGVSSFKISRRSNDFGYRGGFGIDSLIVRIPFSEQAE
jgi:hypothetical protein